MPTVGFNNEIINAISVLSKNTKSTLKIDLVYQLLCEVFNQNINNLVFTVKDIREILPLKYAMYVFEDYLEYVDKIKSKVKLPKSNNQPTKEYLHEYTVSTLDKKYVYDYSGVNFNELDKMPLYTFYNLLRDAYIFKLLVNDRNDILDDCWIAEQTKADRGKLREMFARKEV